VLLYANVAAVCRFFGAVFEPYVYRHGPYRHMSYRVGVEFITPPVTIEVISETVFRANHLTDTDKQNSTGKYTN